MSKSTGRWAALMLPVFVFAGAFGDCALSQEKKMDSGAQSAGPPLGTIKDIAENEKLLVFEATFKPGQGSPTSKRATRVIRALTGGTIERTYADGTKETAQWKAGETKLISEPRAYAFKNVGKSDISFFVVQMK